ncbi:MAG: response regulator [Treponema sp.]|jgi:DNA-binding response OmpR family regulator|nr:response regulator [Treponema sp.]
MDKKVVLVVDDTSMYLRTVKIALEKHFDVRLAKSGEIALSILGATEVDAILLDIDMPGMSGFETLEMIRKLPNAVDTPVIFVTSHVTTELIELALKKGAKDYVMKPFEPDILLRKVFAAANGVGVKHVFITKDGRCFIAPSNDITGVSAV